MGESKLERYEVTSPSELYSTLSEKAKILVLIFSKMSADEQEMLYEVYEVYNQAANDALFRHVDITKSKELSDGFHITATPTFYIMRIPNSQENEAVTDFGSLVEERFTTKDLARLHQSLKNSL